VIEKAEHLPLTAFQGNLLVVCCLSSLADPDAWLLDLQVSPFHECGSVLAVLIQDDYLFGQSWVRPPREFLLPLFLMSFFFCLINIQIVDWKSVPQDLIPFRFISYEGTASFPI
jgi:hypothetical protein